VAMLPVQKKVQCDLQLAKFESISSSLCVQTGSGAHPASHPMGTGGPFPGGKARPRRDADHSPPTSAEVKYEWELYLLSSHVPSWRVAGQLYLLKFESIFHIQCKCHHVSWRMSTRTLVSHWNKQLK
jgi:hypothetical protein